MSSVTKDDQNVHKRHWLLTDEDEEVLNRPREDYSFASLKVNVNMAESRDHTCHDQCQVHL